MQIAPEWREIRGLGKGKTKTMKIGRAYIKKLLYVPKAGEIIGVDGVSYVITSTNHSFKNGWHMTKWNLN